MYISHTIGSYDDTLLRVAVSWTSPSGSTQRIADELGVDVEIVRNYFGGRHFESGNTVGVHFEPGPDGGVVTLDDTAILDCAKRILDERQAN